VTCGTGIQQRQVGCHKVTGLGWLEQDKVSEGQCFGNEKPAIKQQCALEPCSSQYHWMTGPWKPVSSFSPLIISSVGKFYAPLFCPNLSQTNFWEDSKKLFKIKMPLKGKFRFTWNLGRMK